MPKNMLGCFICRIRRKKCNRLGPAQPCASCMRLNIVCLGNAGEPVPPQLKGETSRQVIKEHTKRLANRRGPPLYLMDFVAIGSRDVALVNTCITTPTPSGHRPPPVLNVPLTLQHPPHDNTLGPATPKTSSLPTFEDDPPDATTLLGAEPTTPTCTTLAFTASNLSSPSVACGDRNLWALQHLSTGSSAQDDIVNYCVDGLLSTHDFAHLPPEPTVGYPRDPSQQDCLRPARHPSVGRRYGGQFLRPKTEPYPYPVVGGSPSLPCAGSALNTPTGNATAVTDDSIRSVNQVPQTLDDVGSAPQPSSLTLASPLIPPVPLQPQLAAFVLPLVERPTGHFPGPLSSPSLGIFRSHVEPSYKCHDPQGVITNGAPVAESFPHLPPFLGSFDNDSDPPLGQESTSDSFCLDSPQPDACNAWAHAGRLHGPDSHTGLRW